MRACGQGYAGVETFTTLMNMPKPMTENNYKSVVLKFVESTKEVAEETMSDATQDVMDQASEPSEGDPTDTSISLDGSWQCRLRTFIAQWLCCCHLYGYRKSIGRRANESVL